MVFIIVLVNLIILYRLHKLSPHYSLDKLILATTCILISIFLFSSFPLKLTSLYAYNLTQITFDPIRSGLSLWVKNNLSSDFLIMIVQSMYSLFVGFIFSYSLNTININRQHQFYRQFYIPLLLILTLLIYSSNFYSFILSCDKTFAIFNSININLFFDFSSDILRITCMILLTISLVRLSLNIINQPDKGFYRTVAFYKFALASPYIVLVLMVFFGSPAKLYDLTASGHFFFLNNLMQDRVISSSIALNVFPVAALTTFFFAHKLKKITRRIDFKQLSLSQSIHTASMSIKVFNHSIKNHLLAIQYETENLKTSLDLNTDSEKSLNLIENSINHSLSTLNITKNILNEYHPVKDFYSAESPLLKAVERLPSNHISDMIKIKLPKVIPMCKMDIDAITDAVYNLIINAIDAIGTKKDGEITISLKIQPNFIIITISDNGCGIQPEDIDSVFIPFVSTKSSTTNWGLGLSFCYKVIEAHNGMISVMSNPDEITQFTIQLPLS